MRSCKRLSTTAIEGNAHLEEKEEKMRPHSINGKRINDAPLHNSWNNANRTTPSNPTNGESPPPIKEANTCTAIDTVMQTIHVRRTKEHTVHRHMHALNSEYITKRTRDTHLCQKSQLRTLKSQPNEYLIQSLIV